MSYRESALRPLYTLDYKKDEELLKWMGELYRWRCSDYIELQRLEKQTTQLALYLNYSPSKQRVFSVNSTGSLQVFQKKDYFHLVDPIVKPSIDSWVSRLTARPPNFSVSPAQTTDPSIKHKANIVKSVLNSKFQEQIAAEKDEINVRNSFIFGESYLEVVWNEDSGPLDCEIQKDIEERGSLALEDLGDDSQQIRIGDAEFILHDPRNVIVQRARDYRNAEWVIILDAIPTAKLKAQHPDFEEDIQPTADIKVFSNDMLTPSYEGGYTMTYKLYHRPTLEMPCGYICYATPTVVLSRQTFPSKRWIKNRRFPVLQMTDLDVLGSSRGAASTVMDQITYGQIAYNNLWLQALANSAYFSPKYLIQKGSIDTAHIQSGDRTALLYGKSYGKPELLVQEVISQGHLLLLDKLRDRLLKAANVMPVTVGDSMPNVESRKMLDFVQEQQNNQSVPKDVKHNRFLKDWATLAFELLADLYQSGENRDFQYYGKLRQNESVSMTGADLQVDVDIYVETLTSMASSLQGRIQEIQSIVQVAPGYFTPEEVVEKLNLGSPEKVYDEITYALSAARRDISNILMGKEVQSPSRHQNLFAHYDVYMQEIQNFEIQALLPAIHNPSGKDAGNRILTQIATIESLIIEMLGDVGTTLPNGAVMNKGDMPVVAPQLNLPPQTSYKQYLYGRHPNFPCVYKPDPITTIDPTQPPPQEALPPSPSNLPGSPVMAPNQPPTVASPMAPQGAVPNG